MGASSRCCRFSLPKDGQWVVKMRMLTLAFVLLLPSGICVHSSGHRSVREALRRNLTHVASAAGVEQSTSFLPPNSSGNALELSDRVYNMTNDSANVDAACEGFCAVKKYMDPTVFAIIFIFGAVANVTLLLIFARHEEMRSATNACIFSMAVGDFLSLIVNVPVFYLLLSSKKWTVGVALCKLMWFVSDFAVGLSIFAIAMLSVQRYHGIVNTNVYVYSGRLAIRSRFISHLIVVFIWILSFTFAVRTAITSDVQEDICASVATAYGIQFAKSIALMNLFVFCIIPLCVIAIFYGLTAHYLISSAREMPGEVTAINQKIKYARRKGAKTVLALTFAFFVSYVPWYIWQVLYWAYYYSDYNTAEYTYTFLYYLFFGNLLFNPIALYCVSSTWRRHFNRYLFCIRQADVQHFDEKPTASAKTKSSFLTSTANVAAQSVEDKGL